MNLTAREILGEVPYPDLSSTPDAIDVVYIFRRSTNVADIVEGAIKTGAKTLWMQEVVAEERALAQARENGLLLVMGIGAFSRSTRN